MCDQRSDPSSDQPSKPRFPVYVDTRRVFDSENRCIGSLALDRLPRLAEQLASDKASVEAELIFAIGDYGDKEIRGRVAAKLQISCQRCLEPVDLGISDDISLALVANDEEAAKLRPELDPWICSEIKLQLAELIEEQLLLALPLVCVHSENECQRQMNFAAPEQDSGPDDTEAEAKADSNPFAVLESLKKSD